MPGCGAFTGKEGSTCGKGQKRAGGAVTLFCDEPFGLLQGLFSVTVVEGGEAGGLCSDGVLKRGSGDAQLDLRERGAAGQQEDESWQDDSKFHR